MSQVLLKLIVTLKTQTFFAINKSNFLKFESEWFILKKNEQIKENEVEQKVSFYKNFLKSLCLSLNGSYPVCLNEHTLSGIKLCSE